MFLIKLDHICWEKWNEQLTFSASNLAIRMLFLSVVISMFGNLSLSLIRSPGLFITVVFFARDIIILLSIALAFSFARIDLISRIMLIWLICAFFLSCSFVAFGDVEIKGFVEKFRNMFALPFLILLSNLNFSEVPCIKPIFKIFIVLCFVEALFLMSGNIGAYRELVGVQQYLTAKNTSVNFGFGLFDTLRLSTPMFQPSLGGIIVAVILIRFILWRNYLWGLASFFIVILTLSKTGLMLLVAYPFVLVSPLLTSLGLFISPFGLIEFLQQIDVKHIHSIRYHFAGFFDGFEYLFSPVGVGLSGTVLSAPGREVGAESGIGAYLAAFGVFGFLPLVLAYLNQKKMFFLVLYVAAVIYTEISMNLYVAIIFFVASINSGSGPAENAHKKLHTPNIMKHAKRPEHKPDIP